MSIGQAVQTVTLEDGTAVNFAVAGGLLYRISRDLVSMEEVTPAGITIDPDARVYITPFINKGLMIVNDGVHTPWVGSDLLASPITAEKIDYENDGSDWIAYGPLVVWQGSLFAIVRERNGEGDSAGTPEKRVMRIAWSEVDDPLHGWHQQTDEGNPDDPADDEQAFDNEWDVVQNGSTPINALVGTNNDLIYLRESSIGYLNGSLDDLRTTATHDAIDENTGTRAPATIQQFGTNIFFADTDGRVMLIKSSSLVELWLQMRRYVRDAQTRFPDVTARAACAAIVPELNLYAVVLWSPDPTNDALVFPTVIHVFSASTGAYNGHWTIGPRDGDKVAVHAMGQVVGSNGEARLCLLGKPSLADESEPVGFYILDSEDDEQWHDDDEVPDTYITTHRIGYAANRNINASMGSAIVDTVPDATPTDDDEDIVKTITISPASFELADGETRQLTAVVRNPAGHVMTGVAVTWASDNEAVATVSATGVVTGRSVGGVAHIHATASGAQSNSATVQNTTTVPDTTPASITVTPTAVSLTNGETRQLTAVVKNAAGKVLVGAAVTWSSSNTGVASVSQTGVVTGGPMPGTATITATAGSVSSTASAASVGATIPQTVATVALSPLTVSLTVGQQRQLTATPKDSSGNTVPGVPITWSTSDATIATVSTSGVVTAIAEGDATILATSSNGVASSPCAVEVNPPVTVSDDFDIIEDLLGPSIDFADMPSDFHAAWMNRWLFYMEQSWQLWGPRWDAGNSISGYDRAAICYMLYKLTKDSKWLDRGHQYAVNYRDSYLVPAGYASSPHWSQMEGIYLHWKLTGDTNSLTALLNVAYKLSGFPTNGYFQVAQGEGRIEARVLLALWISEKAGSSDWTATLTTAIQTVLSTMNANGWTPFDSTCGGSLNYMNGMLWDVLGRLRQKRPNVAYNDAIDAKMVAMGNYLWDTQWRGVTPGDSPSFNYMSLLCPSTGGPSPAPDLNGLIVPVFGYLGKYVDSSWFTKGDQIIAGMDNAFLEQDQGYRQLSESYTSSYRYPGYKYS